MPTPLMPAPRRVPVLGDDRGAADDFEQAIRLAPNNAGLYVGRGLARANLGDSRGAMEDFEQSLRLNPNDAEAYAGRGAARLAQGDSQGAAQDFDLASGINPNLVEAVTVRAQARLGLNDAAGAAADLQQALGSNPAMWTCWWSGHLESSLASSLLPSRISNRPFGWRPIMRTLTWGAAPPVSAWTSRRRPRPTSPRRCGWSPTMPTPTPRGEARCGSRQHRRSDRGPHGSDPPRAEQPRRLRNA